jgi:NADH:ubiquinone oxidoreductase subunit D
MTRSIILILGALTLGSLATGCTSSYMQAGGLSDLPDGETVGQAEQPQGTYTVELRADRAEKERVEVTFTGVPYVQQALEKSGATDRFDRMDVKIIRKTNGQIQKMRSSYDHVRKQVPIEWDYALYPGDIIIVTEDPSGMFDDMVESALGPIAFLKGK